MFPVLPLGPLQLPVPQLTLVVSLALAYWLAERWSTRFGLSRNKVGDGLFWGLLAGLVGARLFYVFRYPEAFRASPLSVFSPNPGLLDPIGGLAAAGVFMVWWAQRHQIPLARLADALTPFFAVLQAGYAFSAAARGDYFGMPTRLPWAVTFLGEARHPTALYWFGLSLLVLYWVKRQSELPPSVRPAGVVFWSFVAWSAGVYVFIEGLRGDSLVLENGLRLGHVVALPILALALWQWGKLRKPRPADR